MAYFNELNTNINIVLEYILGDQDLCKLIYYNEPNPLSQPTISDTSILLFDKIYPLPKKVLAEEEKATILNTYFYSSKPYSNNSGFRPVVLCFDIMCHLDVWKIESALRPYSISNKIDTLFNNEYNSDLSMNYIYFMSWSPMQYSDYYYGYNLKYSLSNSSNIGCE